MLPRYAIYTLLIFAPLARASVQPWAVTVIHILTLIALTAFVITKTWQGRFHWIKTPLDKPLIALMALGLISYIFSVHRPTSLAALIQLASYLVIFYLTIHTFRTRKDTSIFQQISSSSLCWWASWPPRIQTRPKNLLNQLVGFPPCFVRTEMDEHDQG